MEPLFWIYASCAAVGVLALLASLFGSDADGLDGLDGFDCLSGNYFYILIFVLWFCAGFGIGGLISHSLGEMESLIVAVISGIICAIFVRMIIRAFIRFCKKNENILSEPAVGDVAVALMDIAPGNIGKVEITHKNGEKSRGYAQSTAYIRSGQKCKISLINDITMLVEPIY